MIYYCGGTVLCGPSAAPKGAAQGVEKGFSTPCKCKSAKAVLHLGHHFLVKWVSWIPHFTARAPSFSEAEGAATLRLPPETRDPPQRGRGAIKKMIEEAAFCRTSQFALVVRELPPPALLCSLGLLPPSSATGGGGMRPSNRQSRFCG